jgi:hypothetical protein
MNDLRKLAAEVVGRDALEERFGTPRLSALDEVLLHKMASADPELLKVAASLEGGSTLDVYEKLGGSYSSQVKE